MQFTDQIGHVISLSKQPQRIISIVPSQTELLFDFELENEVIGITKFCIHPKKWFDTKERIGGTKTLNIEKIRSLKPDLIIANKEENTKEQIELLQSEFNVWTSDIHNLDTAIDMIDQLGVLTNCIPKAQQLIHGIFESQGEIKSNSKSVLYSIWHEPFMVAGSDTFISDMLSAAGFENVVTKGRYPELSAQKVKELQPDFIFLSSEPFPFKEKQRLDYQKQFPDSKVVLVDGELFSWYGSRLLKSFDYFRELNESLAQS